ncbi:hypothetical protein M758_UG037600 [Ceratodon purpureus]|nr:hypothetical protein M758_UG037600 [Ceratodon purpureus]
MSGNLRKPHHRWTSISCVESMQHTISSRCAQDTPYSPSPHSHRPQYYRISFCTLIFRFLHLSLTTFLVDPCLLYLNKRSRVVHPVGCHARTSPRVEQCLLQWPTSVSQKRDATSRLLFWT